PGASRGSCRGVQIKARGCVHVVNANAIFLVRPLPGAGHAEGRERERDVQRWRLRLPVAAARLRLATAWSIKCVAQSKPAARLAGQPVEPEQFVSGGKIATHPRMAGRAAPQIDDQTGAVRSVGEAVDAASTGVEGSHGSLRLGCVGAGWKQTAGPFASLVA